jgi:hypothetical protein
MTGTTPRDDLFILIHKALRAGLFAAAIEAGKIDWNDRVQVEELEGRWSRLVALVQSHAGHEDNYIWPLLESKRRGAVAELGIGHDAVDADIVAVDREFQKAMQNPGSAAGLTFYRALTQFIGHAMEHFASEEPAAMEILWAACTDQELAECRAAFMGTIPPQEAAWTLELILESSSPDELIQVLGVLRSSMPVEAFGAWLDDTKHILPPKTFARLESTLGTLASTGGTVEPPN